MTDGTADAPSQATRPGRRANGSPDPADTREYSERLATLARFTLRHKALVIGIWLGAALVLALLFPQLETVVRQQSVDLIPRDAPSLQTVDRMIAAFGEEGSKTRVFVAMEDPNGLTPTARQRYDELVRRLQADGDHVLLVQDLLADPITEAQTVSSDRKAWYLPVGVTGTLGDPTAAESVNAVRDIAAGGVHRIDHHCASDGASGDVQRHDRLRPARPAVDLNRYRGRDRPDLAGRLPVGVHRAAAAAGNRKISYGDRKGQPDTTASNQGYQLLDRHFRKDVVITEFLVVESPTDMRTGRG